MARERIAIRELVIKKWKKDVLGMGIGLCLVSMPPTNCFAAFLINDRFQRLEQTEDAQKFLPDAKENTGWETAVEMDGWEEEFTDTDTRRGILAVRGEVFQGFGGRIQIRLKEIESDGETNISLTGEADYMANQELRPGSYQILSLEADSDGRKFDCHMEPEGIGVKTDQITLCRIFVTAGSVYQVPFEDEVEIGEERQQKETELTMGKSGEKAEEEKLSTNIKNGYLEEQRKIPFIFLIAGLGAAASLQGVVYAMKGRKK